MARIIGIMGESGAGKTSSFRNLDPKTTIYIDCDKKGLSWKGWREQYNKANKNYFATDDPKKVREIIENINNKGQDVKTVIIDTLNGIMVADEMRRMKEKNFDKWQDLALSVYFLVDYALTMREGLTVIFVAHSQTDREENGYLFTRIRTSGKKLDKIVLESKFPIVLLAKAVNGNHIFETRAKNSTAKTPLGAFESDTVENDIVKVLEVLEEF